MNKLNRRSQESATLHGLAEQILDDEVIGRRYTQTKEVWVGNPDPEQRWQGDHPVIQMVQGDEVWHYGVNVFSGFSVAKAALVQVSKRHDTPNHDPRTYFAGIHNLATGEIERVPIVFSSVDDGRKLWLRTVNTQAIDNWASGRHPEYTRLPRDQYRFEMRLSDNYHAERATFRRGLIETTEFEDIVVLESMIKTIAASRAAKAESLVANLNDRPRLEPAI